MKTAPVAITLKDHVQVAVDVANLQIIAQDQLNIFLGNSLYYFYSCNARLVLFRCVQNPKDTSGRTFLALAPTPAHFPDYYLVGAQEHFWRQQPRSQVYFADMLPDECRFELLKESYVYASHFFIDASIECPYYSCTGQGILPGTYLFLKKRVAPHLQHLACNADHWMVMYDGKEPILALNWYEWWHLFERHADNPEKIRIS